MFNDQRYRRLALTTFQLFFQRTAQIFVKLLVHVGILRMYEVIKKKIELKSHIFFMCSHTVLVCSISQIHWFKLIIHESEQ